MNKLAKRTILPPLKIEDLRTEIEAARTIDEAKANKDKANALQIYYRAQGAGRERQNEVAEYVLWATHKFGELLEEQKRTGQRHTGKGNNPGKLKSQPATPTLADLGIKKDEAARAQRLAKLPKKKLETYVKETKAAGGEITTTGAAKAVVGEAKAKAKQAKAEEIKREPAPLPDGKFRVIVLDPPWKYDARADDPTHRGRNQYPDMTVEEIAALPVEHRAHEDCVLFLWITNSFLIEGAHLKCLDAWGFTGKTILTWDKVNMGVGDYLRNVTEHCILAVRGRPLLQLTNQTTLITEKRREHSRKPEAFYSLVESLCPGSKLEMFSRAERAGWQSWGAETGKFEGAA